VDQAEAWNWIVKTVVPWSTVPADSGRRLTMMYFVFVLADVMSAAL
jgi:hypothetical protein